VKGELEEFERMERERHRLREEGFYNRSGNVCI